MIKMKFSEINENNKTFPEGEKKIQSTILWKKNFNWNKKLPFKELVLAVREFCLKLFLACRSLGGEGEEWLLVVSEPFGCAVDFLEGLVMLGFVVFPRVYTSIY